ncbi:GDP-D-glucose phosphorylase 1 [Clonorchis sinensis]|uniref:GDP-D-glucose phosphorylase 1 n=2 Tax=Clonorchis sinensis TaxID=79923 RepID=A0A8T1MXI6_CLOSI|nr:GDP-D-glucose phosphorylase 1 [Clonorchis sinensis]
MTLFNYNQLDFVIRASGRRTKFDQILSDLWTKAHDTGKFRYKLPQDKILRVLDDISFKPVILVLPERFKLRRRPTEVLSLNDPPTGFHFNNIAREEILLSLNSTNGNSVPKEESLLLIANISPFTPLHCLLVPEPQACFNQRIRKPALRAVVECFLLSDNQYLCMGFNSLLAHASVNHLHFHLWQAPEPLYAMVEDTRTKPNLPAYSELPEHPVHNFTFELSTVDGIGQFIDSIWRVIEACHSGEIAHNLFLARVLNHKSNHGLLRAVLWPRRSVYTPKTVGSEDKIETGYNVAVAELAGMFVVASHEVAAGMCQATVLRALTAERVSEEVIKSLEAKLLD